MLLYVMRGNHCSTIELGKIFSYYLLKLKSVNSICPVDKWRDTNPTWQNLDWIPTVVWLHWKWLYFQLVVLSSRGIQPPNTEIDFELSSNNWIISSDFTVTKQTRFFAMTLQIPAFQSFLQQDLHLGAVYVCLRRWKCSENWIKQTVSQVSPLC